MNEATTTLTRAVLGVVIRENVSVEDVSLFRRWCLKKCEIELLASHYIQCTTKSFKERLRQRNDLDIHDA